MTKNERNVDNATYYGLNRVDRDLQAYNARLLALACGATFTPSLAAALDLLPW